MIDFTDGARRWFDIDKFYWRARRWSNTDAASMPARLRRHHQRHPNTATATKNCVRKGAQITRDVTPPISLQQSPEGRTQMERRTTAVAGTSRLANQQSRSWKRNTRIMHIVNQSIVDCCIDNCQSVPPISTVARNI